MSLFSKENQRVIPLEKEEEEDRQLLKILCEDCGGREKKSGVSCKCLLITPNNNPNEEIKKIEQVQKITRKTNINSVTKGNPILKTPNNNSTKDTTKENSNSTSNNNDNNFNSNIQPATTNRKLHNFFKVPVCVSNTKYKLHKIHSNCSSTKNEDANLSQNQQEKTEKNDRNYMFLNNNYSENAQNMEKKHVIKEPQTPSDLRNKVNPGENLFKFRPLSAKKALDFIYKINNNNNTSIDDSNKTDKKRSENKEEKMKNNNLLFSFGANFNCEINDANIMTEASNCSSSVKRIKLKELDISDGGDDGGFGGKGENKSDNEVRGRLVGEREVALRGKDKTHMKLMIDVDMINKEHESNEDNQIINYEKGLRIHKNCKPKKRVKRINSTSTTQRHKKPQSFSRTGAQTPKVDNEINFNIEKELVLPKLDGYFMYDREEREKIDFHLGVIKSNINDLKKILNKCNNCCVNNKSNCACNTKTISNLIKIPKLDKSSAQNKNESAHLNYFRKGKSSRNVVQI